MIVHYNHDKPTSVYVVNSRLPVYRAFYGDGFGNVLAGLFTRMAPKVAPFAKQLGMKAIDVIRDKGLGAIGNLAGKAFSTATDRIASLSRRVFSRKKPTKVDMPSTAVMPASVSKEINRAVEQKLASMTSSLVPAAESLTPSLTPANNAIMSAIAGSGLRKKRR